MTFQLHLGWWLLPFAVTIAAFVWRYWVHKDDQPSYGYGRIGAGLGELLTLAAALIVSLVAWLIWALVA